MTNKIYPPTKPVRFREIMPSSEQKKASQPLVPTFTNWAKRPRNIGRDIRQTPATPK